MNKLNDKKKQAIVNQKSVQKVTKPTQVTKKTVSSGLSSTRAIGSEIKKTTPKKDNAKLMLSKPVVAKPSPAKIQKKSIKTKKLASKPMKHIADQIKALPSKRVWPD